MTNVPKWSFHYNWQVSSEIKICFTDVNLSTFYSCKKHHFDNQSSNCILVLFLNISLKSISLIPKNMSMWPSNDSML